MGIQVDESGVAADEQSVGGDFIQRMDMVAHTRHDGKHSLQTPTLVEEQQARGPRTHPEATVVGLRHRVAAHVGRSILKRHQLELRGGLVEAHQHLGLSATKEPDLVVGIDEDARLQVLPPLDDILLRLLSRRMIATDDAALSRYPDIAVAVGSKGEHCRIQLADDALETLCAEVEKPHPLRGAHVETVGDRQQG